MKLVAGLAWATRSAGRVEVNWRSDSSGDVRVSDFRLDGDLLAVETIPVAAPTALYDVYLYDRNGRDVLSAKAKDRSESDVEYVTLYKTAPEDTAGNPIRVDTEQVRGLHTLVVKNAGAGTQGRIVFHLNVQPQRAEAPLPPRVPGQAPIA